MVLKTFFTIVVCFIVAPSVYALPQFTVLTGNKCISCHIQSHGGGLRSDLGAYSYMDVALVKPESIGLGSLFSPFEENTFFDGKLTVGADARFQTVRAHSPDTAVRKYFPMQGSLYAQYAVMNELKVEANYNAGHSSKNRYPGQQAWGASVLFQPNMDLPILRIGRFSPNVGIRYDDHSKMTRQFFSPTGTNLTTNFLPPAFAEFGAELTYDSWHSMTASLGVFGSYAMSEILVENNAGNRVSLVSASNMPTMVGRVEFMDQFFEKALHTSIGASAMVNDDFSNIRGFGTIGIIDKAAIMIEYSETEKRNVQKTSVLSFDGMYPIVEGLSATARYETGKTVIANGNTNNVYSIVLGAQAFVLPHIELRPEYRILDTENFRSSRWAMQIHLFY